MNKKTKILSEDNTEFQNILNDIITNETVLQMKNYRQHCLTSCYDHCYLAAYYCYIICKKLQLDYISATRAAMLHDLFLYDWREKSNRKGLHAFTHGKYACENACKLFELNEKEKDIIKNHMWPVTINFPKSYECLILTFIDKYCAILEFFEYLKISIFKQKIVKFASFFFGIFVFKK